MADRDGIEAARSLLARAIRERIFPAAVVEVGGSGGSLWHEAFGHLTFDEMRSVDDALELVLDLR